MAQVWLKRFLASNPPTHARIQQGAAIEVARLVARSIQAMPILSAVAAELLTKTFRFAREELQKVREAASASEDVSSGTKVLRVLERLAKLPVTLEVLKETGIGKEVNDRFFRRHVDPLVRERSEVLVDKWKARAQAIAAEAAEQAEAAREKRKAEDDGSIDAAKAAKVESGSGPNEAIAALFKELSDFEFKKGTDKFQAIAYKMAAARLRGHQEKILSGKEASKLQDIGKISAQKIDEFLSDGKIEKLEKYRRGEFEWCENEQHQRHAENLRTRAQMRKPLERRPLL